MEQVLDKAVVRGETVLRLLMQTESELPGEWDYLLGFRRRDTRATARGRSDLHFATPAVVG